MPALNRKHDIGMFYYYAIAEYVNKILYRPVTVRVVVVQTKARRRVSCETFKKSEPDGTGKRTRHTIDQCFPTVFLEEHQQYTFRMCPLSVPYISGLGSLY